MDDLLMGGLCMLLGLGIYLAGWWVLYGMYQNKDE